jgi:hypothetical protein
MNDPQTVEVRIRSIRFLWFAMLSSVALYYFFGLIRGRPENVTANPSLSLALLIAGISTTLISFLIKAKLLKKAVEQQNLVMIQQAYIVTFAMTEVATLLGLLDFFVTSDRYYYGLFIIAALGMLLHFPRREHVVNAAFNSSVM